MVVYNGSFSYDMWLTTPIPMYNKVYYFNVTNAEEVNVNKSAKPLLEQVGPYTFREQHEKTDIFFNKHNQPREGSDDTVQFRQKKFWYFEEDLSSGSLDDEIWTLNLIAVSAADGTRWPGSFGADDYPFLRFMMDASIKADNQMLFIKARVGNLTFEGLDNPLLHMGDIDGDLGDAITASIPFDRFGWFYERNGSESYDGIFQMNTGADDAYKVIIIDIIVIVIVIIMIMKTILTEAYQVGQITEWNQRGDVSHLYPAPCDRLEGSAGEFFPQDQVRHPQESFHHFLFQEKTSISYFTPDLCRPIHFNFKEETEVSGVSGFRYQLDEGLVANSTYNATNSCYNPYPDHVPNITEDWQTGDPATSRYIVEQHLPNGLLNVSSCKFNSPSYVSFPHFYLADPALLDQFHPDSSLHPNKEQHASFLTLMPQQGIPLEVAIRIQINILYRPFVGFPIDLFADRQPIFFPAVWFETVTVMPYDLASQLQLLQLVPGLGNIMGAVFLTVGLVILAGVVAYRRRGVLPRLFKRRSLRIQPSGLKEERAGGRIGPPEYPGNN